MAAGDYLYSAAHHTDHHLLFNYNYGQFFTLWDRIGGSYKTYLPFLCVCGGACGVKTPVCSSHRGWWCSPLVHESPEKQEEAKRKKAARKQKKAE